MRKGKMMKKTVLARYPRRSTTFSRNPVTQINPGEKRSRQRRVHETESRRKTIVKFYGELEVLLHYNFLSRESTCIRNEAFTSTIRYLAVKLS